jgi:hypothetical protein
MDTIGSSHLSKNHAKLQLSIKRKVHALKKDDKIVDMTWIGGHIDLEGNDYADKMAKEAATSANNQSLDAHLSPSEATNQTKHGLKNAWQRRWDTHSTNSTTHHYCTKVSLNSYKSTINRKAETMLNRIKLGHHKLKDRLHRIMPRAYPSAECECGKDRQTAEHVILHCILHAQHRDTLLNAVELSYIKHNIPLLKRKIGLKSLLSPPLNKDINSEINAAVANFLTDIDIDI